MIALASDCLIFKLANGESVPFFADMVSVEVEGGLAGAFDSEFLQHAANAVFHYFKQELGRQTVTLGEFAEAMEKVLGGFASGAQPAADSASNPPAPESDLRRLASEFGQGGELFFFPRLRAELHRHLEQAPRVLRFRGLRGCVKQLVGARRWSPRCQSLEGEIVAYLRQCLHAASALGEVALLLE